MVAEAGFRVAGCAERCAGSALPSAVPPAASSEDAINRDDGCIAAAPITSKSAMANRAPTALRLDGLLPDDLLLNDLLFNDLGALSMRLCLRNLILGGTETRLKLAAGATLEPGIQRE